MKSRVYIVDDHPITRLGFRYLIDEEMDMEVCGEASNAIEAMDQIQENNPDILITDVTMEGMSGLELLKNLKVQHPELPVLVVSMHEESLFGDRALRAGARGYIMKSEVDLVLVKAIRHILNGGVYVSEEMSTKILFQYSGSSVGDFKSPIETLSDRELEVFEHTGHGRSTKDVADAMLVSTKTVETYRTRIKSKLGLNTHVELLQHAIQWVQNEGR